jgi:uncharacterized repeat protein (TIGR01451 family)
MPDVAGGVRQRVQWLRRSLLPLFIFSSWAAVGQSGGADVYVPVPAGHKALPRPGATTLSGPTGGTTTNAVQAVPTAYARTSRIMLNTFGDTPLGVPLAAVDTDGTISSYTVTVLPPAAAGILRLGGAPVTTSTVIAAANAGNLTFDPVAGYFGTAVFSYTAKDNSGGSSAAVTYGIPVAKATCGAGVGQANELSFYARTEGEDWKVNRQVTVSGVTITANPTGTPYTSSPASTNVFFVSDQTGSMPGKGLVWAEDYSSSAAMTSSATFTFSRPLGNFTLSIGDLDNGTGYIDELTLQGYDVNNNLVSITAANVKTGTTNTFSNNVFTGVSNTGPNANNNAIATFPTPIVKLVMTYRNVITGVADPAVQLIVFPAFAWCAQADIQATLTGPTRAQGASTVTYTATTRNGIGDAVNTITPTVQLPANLTGVTGGTYNFSTGLLTLPVISSLAAGASVVQSISYTMPTTGSITATLSFTSTADDPTASNNTSTLTTTQNRPPIASSVVSSPAILSGTTSQTNTAPFNASDPDATTGNTTIVSYTIYSLPTTTQGVLYVNGSPATVSQVITVPTTATPANPGYQLSFIPGSTFTGSANVQYRAADDIGSFSNYANYDIPVTAGADVAVSVNGSTTGVEGQSKANSITTVNNGPSVATNVVSTITLSNRPPFSSVSVTNGTYDPGTGIVTFNPIASLASGASFFNTVTVVIQATPATFTLTGASTSATADPTPANNNGTAPAAILTVTVSPIGPAGTASACATPGRDGSPTITANPDTYYPAANQTVAVNASSFTVGAATGGILTPIATGDLLLIIQMQAADINATNTDSYGDGVAGGFASNALLNANYTAGQYEYAVAASAVPISGGTLTTTAGLRNSYQNADAVAGSTGPRRFQVVRIPQYQNLIVSGVVTADAWNGRTGGILALDVTGKLSFVSSGRLDASGKGFRGGAGQKLLGTSGLTGTDYRVAATGTTTVGAHASKGEGTAGTPRYVTNGTVLLDLGVDNYPNGSLGRGAPGNAGGGGTDANPSANDQNSGGGGGANVSRGGRGGNTGTSNAAVGGETGGSFNFPSSSRLILGGGGGAGTTNNGSRDAGNTGYASSGAPGGGIVLVRTGSVAGLGAIWANGGSASNTVADDGSGGGGAGGSIVFTANNTAAVGVLNMAANGGSGGTNSGSNGSSATPFGPGGGGSGGIILTNAPPASAAVAGGSNGTTAGGTAYGASAALAGISNNQISTSIANSTAGINCSFDVTATLTTPSSASAGQTVALSTVFANNGGVSASTVTRTVTLASGSASNPFTTVSAPGGAISGLNTNVVTITYPTMANLTAGSSTPFNISYTAPGTATITATAAITTTSSPEPVTDNNTSPATTSITGFADVVTAVFGLNTSTTGRPTASYAVVFANNGPAAATNVTRTLTLPAGATLTTDQLNAITAQGGNYNGGNPVVIDFGTLATLNSRGASIFKFSYTAPNAGGSTTIGSTITTATAQDAGGGTGAATAPDTFSFVVMNNQTADVATASITPSAATVVPGQAASFVVNFVNNGPGAAINALRYADLSPNLSGVVVTDYDNSILTGAYDATTGIVTYPVVASVPNEDTVPSTITFTAPAIGPVVISGSMSTAAPSVSSGIFDNNQATASISVTPIADVATTISGPTSVVRGNLATFAIITTNQGPSPATTVVQTVQLPGGLAATGVFATNDGSYNSTNGLVTFPAVAVLANGAAINNTVSFSMPMAAFTATVAVTTATDEAGALANNTSAAAATTAAAVTTDQANVYTALSFSDKNVMPGAPLTLTLETGNHGPNTALNVVQRLVLPPGLSVGSISGGGIYNATTGRVTFTALASQASGSSVSNTIVLTAPLVGPVVAIASVTTSTSDPVPADNVQIRNIDVVKMTDVATVLVGPGIASATQVPRFTVSTINNGPVAATNVVQTVTIIAGFTLSEVTATGGGVYDPTTGVITWPAVATLAVGAVRTYTYSYVAPAFKSTDAANPHTIVSQAGVISTMLDGMPLNNTKALATEIKWTADVAVAVSGPTSAVAGNPITFSVSTINNGPAPAASVTTTARIATGITNLVASGGGVYDITTGIVTFPTIFDQAVGASGAITNTISLLVPDRPIIGVSAAANVPATSNDINLTDNAATLILPVTPPTTTLVDLQTTIVSDVVTQQAGRPVVLTITATNAGTTASNIRQRVMLPAGLSSVVVTNAAGSILTGAYDAASGGVTFPLASAQPASTVLTYTITLNDPSKDPLVATASVNGDFSDPTPANNTQTLSVSILPVADVTTRISGPATMLPNSQATYQVITLNNGPSPASAVVQTVQLPTGLSNVLMSGSGSYNAASGLVTFPTISMQAVGKAGEVTNTIRFLFPTTAFTIGGGVSSGTTEDAATVVNNTSALTTGLTDQIPLANTFSNRLQAPIGNTAAPVTITALSGFDLDGAPASFTITTLPATGTGVLSLNGAPVVASQVISLANAANLRFDPVDTYVGNTFFSYTATDNLGAVSAPALYTITSGLDNASVYSTTPTKGGANLYQNGDVIANVFDANGGTYGATAAVTDNGIRTASLSSGVLPAGTELDPATGQVRVFNRSLLVTGTYPVSISTTDANGGMTTKVVSFQIGDYPLPVTLTQFQATAAGLDGQLTWATAQEQDNVGFDVERAFDGIAFTLLTFVPGAGTSGQPHRYSFVDAGVGQRPGQVYYRLRQHDHSGKASYSPVQVIKFTQALVSGAALYPNPAATRTTLDLTRMPGTTYQVTLVDMAGRVVQTQVLPGGLAHTLAVDQLTSGTYLVIVSDGTSRSILHLLKN